MFRGAEVVVDISIVTRKLALSSFVITKVIKMNAPNTRNNIIAQNGLNVKRNLTQIVLLNGSLQ